MDSEKKKEAPIPWTGILDAFMEYEHLAKLKLYSCEKTLNYFYYRVCSFIFFGKSGSLYELRAYMKILSFYLVFLEMYWV